MDTAPVQLDQRGNPWREKGSEASGSNCGGGTDVVSRGRNPSLLPQIVINSPTSLFIHSDFCDQEHS